MRDILLLPGHLGDCILAIQQGQLSHSPVQLQGHLKELGSPGKSKKGEDDIYTCEDYGFFRLICEDYDFRTKTTKNINRGWISVQNYSN